MKEKPLRGYFGAFGALSVISAFVALYILSRSSWGTIDPSLFRSFPVDPSQINSIVVSGEPTQVEWEQVAEGTLSASRNSTETLGLAILFFSIFLASVVVALRVFRPEKWIRDFVVLGLSGIAIIGVTVGRVDDLDDEAYAWASKMEQFFLNGVLGVPLFDGRFGESSVGTLHFIISAVLFAFFGFSVEQALLWVVLIASLAAAGILYFALRSKNFPSILAATVTLLIFLAPPIVQTSSKAFDNSLVLSLLVIWLAGESLLAPSRRPALRVIVATLAPLVRLEFALFSIVLMIGDILLERARTQGGLQVLLRKTLKRWAPAGATAILWIIYKVVAFGTVVPAMATYKSPWLDVGAFEGGSRYLLESMGEPAFFLLGGAAVLLLMRFAIMPKMWGRFTNWFEENLVTLLPLSLATAFGIFSAVTSGGDYFGPDYARYFFPYAGAWIVVLLLQVRWLRKTEGWLNPSLAAVVTLALVFSINSPSRHQAQFDDISAVVSGRVTCDRAGLVAVRTLLSERGVPRPEVVASPEINGAAYYLDAELVDMISLVDPDTDRILAPQKPGSTFDKFQVTLSESQLRGIDLVWLWPSAQCDLTKDELDEQLSDGEEVMREFLTNPDGLYRFPQVEQAISSGLQPVVAGFQYEQQGAMKYGLLRFLARDFSD